MNRKEISPTKKRVIWLVVLVLVFFFGIRNYISSVADIVVPAGSYSISSWDNLYSLSKKFKLEVADSRFKAYVRYFAPELKLQTGTYSVGEGITVGELFTKILQNWPTSKEINITFLPGWTVYDVESALKQYNLVGTGEITQPSAELFTKLSKKYSFLSASDKSFEGFLYPDTYRFSLSSGIEGILSKFLDNFSKKIASKYSNISNKELYKTLVLASIVEKEERSDDNRGVVAGILQKRIDEKMYLGADATLCYPYKLLYKECTPAFIAEHLDDDTPYNSRKHIGLPPTPITSPTFSSFSAAKNPEQTSYYYYLHDDNWVIHYGVTLQDHNRNKAQYLR